MVQGLSINQWWCCALSRPLELIVGVPIFAMVAAGGVVRHVASTALAVLFVTSFFYVRSWPKTWRQLTSAERLVLLGFGLYVISAFLSYYNVSDEREYIKHLGKYARFLVILPIYLLLSRANLNLFPYLLAGAIIAGPLYFGTALLSITEKPGLPAQGYYHHITFGDAAMLNVVFLLAALVTWKTRPIIRAVMVVSIICALYASILSQARGAWIALPFCGALLFYLMIKRNKLKVKIVLPVLLLVVVVVGVSPVGNVMENRVKEAVHEVGSFVSGEKFACTIGRLVFILNGVVLFSGCCCHRLNCSFRASGSA